MVYGFGAIKKFRDAVGYTGVQALDLYQDCINNNKDFEPAKILQHTIPLIRKSNKTNVPIYKYLRELGINNDEEYNNNPLGLNFSLPKSTDFASYKSFSSEEKKFSLQQAISVFLGKEKWKAVALIPYLEVSSETDLSLLKQFISDNLVDFLVRNNSYSTYMRKLICFYDCVKYGWRG